MVRLHGPVVQAPGQVRWAEDVGPVDRILCADAQTSGGLLLAVPPENEAALLEALRAEATPAVAVIGRVVAGEPGAIAVHRRL